jgi:hypothetical protein
LVALQAHYGTDGAVSGAGFHLDEVAVTAARLQVPDAQSAVCPLFADGFESGGAERWSAAVP